ncbi:MAG: hypothetical protein IFK94_12180 [Acidobacteria bacterium]|uniref:Uncharacterized protein n=1 Tax=Candidatus Polarisedimenticola svalbardensis TaxID=2886004 RepID=A0A8J6Y9H3_9BACT|nr:hypothetical protein [Candidatus Polarisedimenticola svalbardensis]
MTADKEPKSAFEIAMERIRAKDRAAGIDAPKTLTDKQKQQIAELRAEGKAKLAELEIFRGGKIAEAAGDPEKLAQVEEHYRIDRERIQSRMETEIGKVKG